MGKRLRLLLQKLKERQSWCPYCSGEYGHNDVNGNPCILQGLWFADETKDD